MKIVHLSGSSKSSLIYSLASEIALSCPIQIPPSNTTHQQSTVTISAVFDSDHSPEGPAKYLVASARSTYFSATGSEPCPCDALPPVQRCTTRDQIVASRHLRQPPVGKSRVGVHLITEELHKPSNAPICYLYSLYDNFDPHSPLWSLDRSLQAMPSYHQICSSRTERSHRVRSMEGPCWRTLASCRRTRDAISWLQDQCLHLDSHHKYQHAGWLRRHKSNMCPQAGLAPSAFPEPPVHLVCRTAIQPSVRKCALPVHQPPPSPPGPGKGLTSCGWPSSVEPPSLIEMMGTAALVHELNY